MSVICPVCGVDGADKKGQVGGRDTFLYGCPRCGWFVADYLFDLSDRQKAKRYLLAGILRRASSEARPYSLDPERVDALLASVRVPATLFEAVDETLLFLASRVSDYWAPAIFDEDKDYPLVLAPSGRHMKHLLTTAANLTYFAPGDSTISLPGWRRIDELRATKVGGSQAFVAMWFDKQLDDAWLNGFKAGIEDTGSFKAIRIDAIEHNERIDDRILAEVRRSGLLVADFSGDRAGVYFEAGFGLGLGIPVIWTCRSDFKNKLHFDTRQYNHIIWDAVGELRDRLSARILATIPLPPSAVLAG